MEVWKCLIFFALFPVMTDAFDIPIFKTFIHGPGVVRRGSHVTLMCNHTHDGINPPIANFTFFETDREKCAILRRDLSAFTSISEDNRELRLNFPLNSSLTGNIKFTCIPRTKEKEHFGCHNVLIKSMPTLPNVSCVSHGLQRLRCLTKPSVEETAGNTSSQSYSVITEDGGPIQCLRNPPHSKKRSDCYITSKGEIRYNLPELPATTTLQITLTNVLGTVEKSYVFNMCEIEQPEIRSFTVNKKRATFVILNWDITNSLLKNVKKNIYESEVMCKNSSSHLVSRNKTFQFVMEILDLRSFSNYECVVKTRTRLRMRVGICSGKWSVRRSIRFQTAPTKPSRGPLVFNGMILRVGEVCRLYFFEIPNEFRNGIVKEYRIRIDARQLFTRFLNLKFNCSKEKSSDKIQISGRTIGGGWSPESEVNFFAIDVNSANRSVELELWKHREDSYKAIAKFVPKRKLKNVFLAVCNCSNGCHKIPDCVEMRRITPTRIFDEMAIFDNIVLNLKQERVIAHYTFKEQPPYEMTDWVSCAFDNSTKTPYKKELFTGTKVSYDDDKLNIRLSWNNFKCSENIRRPVQKVFSRVVCDGKIRKSLKTVKKNRMIQNITLPYRQQTRKCVVEMSVDNRRFEEVSVSNNIEKRTNYVTIILPTLSAFIILIVCVVICSKLSVLKKCYQNVMRSPSMQGINSQPPMPLHPSTSRNYSAPEPNYESVLLSDAPYRQSLETEDTESGSIEQGVTENTNLTSSTTRKEDVPDISFASGYIRQERPSQPV